MTWHGALRYPARVTGPASARIAFETARLSLARQVLAPDATLEQAYAHAARVSAQALRMSRVGIWRFEDDDQRLVCQCLYSASTQTITHGEVLDARTFPSYVKALRERRAIGVTDARTHRVTSELTLPYLNVHGITSLLDAPIIIDGRVIGVVCHEHAGPEREFEQHELDFAGSVADMVALVENQAERLRLEVALREQEELVQRAAKLEALGRLARTAAHDFNNALGVVMVAGDALARHADPLVRDLATSVIDAAAMGARISRDLLVVGREAPSQPQRLQLNDTLPALAHVLRARFTDRVDVKVEISGEHTVLADPSQIERVVLNLGINAGEAIAERGTILLRLREPVSEEVAGRGWVALEVSDDGMGMTADVIAHLFEPYFTTKPNGHGLGLASVYGIVRQLKGRVLVHSELGKGTTFVVILPIVA